jgi:membrane peptidoglycan carboxypeptidase
MNKKNLKKDFKFQASKMSRSLKSGLNKPLPSKNKKTTTSLNYKNLSSAESKKSSSGRGTLNSRRNSRNLSSPLGKPPAGRIKKALWYAHPKRFFKFLFSREGLYFSLKAAGIGILLLGLFIFGLFAYYRKDLNKLKPEEIANRINNSGVKYYDRTGQVLLWEQKGQKDRTVVESEQISDNIKKATIALEDRNFESHRGFDPRGLARAILRNSSSGNATSQGGSTITQQLVKNELLTTEKSISRKLKELILAIEVERTYSKDQILTLYLNSNNYGGTATGIERASQRYFGDGKRAADLSLDEAIFLASIPQSPSRYDPYRDSFRPDLLEARMKAALKGMVEMGFVSQQEANSISTTAVLDRVQPKELALKGQYDDIKAPHFVLEVEKQLEEKFGNKALQTGGYKVITTLDWDMQQIADEQVAKGMATVDRGGGDNAALVSVDVETGQVLAYVGSRDFRYEGFGEYNEATEPRQPGSSIKPFAYAKLMESPNWGPGSTILDTPKSWPGLGGNGEAYNPQNFDNKFKGPMSMRNALSESRNLPALRAIEIAGVEPTVQLAKAMGDDDLCELTKKAGKSYNIAVVLGGCEVKLEEHVQAYSTFARAGKAKPQAKVLRVEASNGEILEEWKDAPGEQALNPEIAWLMGDILSDDAARAGTFGRNNRDIVIPGIKAAAKTGTTNRNAEGWMMGYTAKIATGVLVNNSDRGGMNGITSRMTGPIYTGFMREVYNLKGWKSADFFEKPSGIQQLNVNGRTDFFQSWFKKPRELPGKEFVVDRVSRKLATSCTPDAAKETVQAIAIQAGPTEAEVEYQAEGYDLKNQDDFHKCDDIKPTVSLVSSSAGAPGKYNITINLGQGTHALQAVSLYVDGNLVQNIGPNPGSTTVSQTLSPGQHTIRVVSQDVAYYSSESSITINVPANP